RAVVKVVGQLQPGDCFIDAGANIGFYSVMASARVGVTGRVVAVEMIPATAAVLRDQLRLNGAVNTTVIERALSARPGEVVTARLPAAQHGQASIVVSNPGGQTLEVETTTLDEIVSGLATSVQ